VPELTELWCDESVRVRNAPPYLLVRRDD